MAVRSAHWGISSVVVGPRRSGAKMKEREAEKIRVDEESDGYAVLASSILHIA